MPDNHSSEGILRTRRDAPPMDYSFTIQSFSLLQQTKVDKYESESFDFQHEKWRLCVYPNGNTKGNGEGHISLSMELANDVPFPNFWHRDVELIFFVQDKVNNKYLMVQDGKTKRFDAMKTEWGIDQVLPIDIFSNPADGYLDNDCCTFGVEIFVIKGPTGRWESLSMVKKPAHGSFTWKIEDFSKLDKAVYDSPEFTSGERSWKISINPKGDGVAKGNFLSVYLKLVDADKLPPKKKIRAEFNLRVVNQKQAEKTLETRNSIWFTYPDTLTWGRRKFISLGELHQTSKGYVLDDDTLIVEAEIACISVSKVVS